MRTYRGGPLRPSEIPSWASERYPDTQIPPTDQGGGFCRAYLGQDSGGSLSIRAWNQSLNSSPQRSQR